MRPNQAFHVLEELSNNSIAPLYRKGVELSLEDAQTTREVYQQWLLLFLDLGYLNPETFARFGTRLWVDITRVDVLDLNNAFAEGLQLLRLQTSKGFKGLCSSISSHLYPLIKDDLALMLESDVRAAKRLMQLFSYTSRLSLQDIDLSQQMFEEYLSNEAAIAETFDESLICRLNTIIKRWFSPFGPDEIFPSHGPGGVAFLGRCSLEFKYLDLTTDQLLEYAFGEPWWITSPIRSSMDRISQTIFVAKSYKTFRTISMEPTTLQYFQQGVWKAIDHQVLRNRYLKSHVDFHDQDRNRRLAQAGSITKQYATLDLSSASDLVGYRLVKQIFKGTWLLKYLVATRSKKTMLADGRILTLKKFAPMGSSLCFPIESIIFAAVCELVTRDYRVFGDYSVFGDDIIVPTQCVGKTIETLTQLGFRVNREKSFYQRNCWFRESCGGEYCDGFDVTPMRVSRKYAAKEPMIRLSKLITMANTAYEKDFRFLRYYFLQKLRRSNYVALFSPTCLLSDNYTNYHTKTRWNRSLQKIQVKVSDLVDKKINRSSSTEEIVRLRHWFESTLNRKDIGDGFESNVQQSAVRVQRVWRDKPYEELDQAFIDHHVKQGEILSR